jgi:Fic family protein
VSRAVGTRDCPGLYPRILKHLAKYPDGQLAFNISEGLRGVNDGTCRKYLADLVDKGKVEIMNTGERKKVYRVLQSVTNQNIK